MENQHFLLLLMPTQGQINPTLQLAKNLLLAGGKVTFATTEHGRSLINTFPTIDGLSFTIFTVGDNDQNTKAKDENESDPLVYMAKLKETGTRNLIKLLETMSVEGRPVTFVIYTILFPWAAEVARSMHVPSAFLVTQNATTFAIYYHFMNGINGLYNDDNYSIDSSVSINLMGLPLFGYNDIPTLLLPTNPYYASMTPVLKQHIQVLEEDPDPCVLINTFEAIEEDSIKYFCNTINLITIGPLIPSAFAGGNDLSERSFGCDLFDSSREYLQWLNSKPEKSVVYVSFGSLVELKKSEKGEIFQGLIEFGKPFLWVIRSSENERDDVIRAMVKNGMSDEKGMIVPWCSQMEVLHHRSTGCFVTHCGWNSTLESLVAGVPMVCRPEFSDQTTNAKMVDEVWKVGVRVKVDDEKGLVSGEEIKRCLDLVMGEGEKGEEIRRNSVKWKASALGAIKEEGSSHNNLKQFLKASNRSTR